MCADQKIHTVISINVLMLINDLYFKRNYPESIVNKVGVQFSAFSCSFLGKLAKILGRQPHPDFMQFALES